MSTPTATISSTRFADFFDTALPRGLRELAGDMSWDDVARAFGSGAGPVRLGQWERIDRPSGCHVHTYRAVLVVGEQISMPTVSATGPIAALTAMLSEKGIALEILNFHQLRAGGQTATFIRGTDGSGVAWAIGWSECSVQSALRAMVACTNRLLAA